MKNSSKFSRREVLRTASFAAGATMLPGSMWAQAKGSQPADLKPPSPAQDLPIRLGIATYTFRKFDAAKMVDFVKQLKTPYLDLKEMHLPMGTPQEVAAQAASYRQQGFILTAVGNVTFPNDDEADIRKKFDYAKAAGVPTIVCAPNHQNLPTLEKFVKEYNIKLAIHNHGPEDKNFPSPFDVLSAVKNLDQRIGLCIDIGHATRAGADVPAAIHAAGPRLHAMHTKDLANRNERDSQVAVGEGLLPIRDIFKALIDTKYAGTVDLEYEIHPDDPFPGVMESFAYMRGVLAGMGYK